MKRVLSFILTIIMIISFMPFSYAEENTDIAGKFTENGYENDYFLFKWESLNAENNEVSELKSSEEIKQYLQENEFYTIYKENEKTVSIYRTGCYGGAISESQFLKQLAENANTFPWIDDEDQAKPEFKFINSIVGDSYNAAPSILYQIADISILVYCFINEEYTLVTTILEKDERYGGIYDRESRIQNDISEWQNTVSVCEVGYDAITYFLGVTENGEVVTAGVLPHGADIVYNVSA